MLILRKPMERKLPKSVNYLMVLFGRIIINTLGRKHKNSGGGIHHARIPPLLFYLTVFIIRHYALYLSNDCSFVICTIRYLFSSNIYALDIWLLSHDITSH